MLKKTVTYENFDGDQVTDTLFFHLSKAELVMMEHSMDGGLSRYIQNLIDKGDGKTIMETFTKLLLDSYGEKTEDGKGFVKTPEVRQRFASSEAYSTIFMELATDADAAAEFINGIIPAGLEQEMAEVEQRQQDKPGPEQLREIEKIRRAEKEARQEAKETDPQPDGLEEEEAPQPLGVAAQEQRIITMVEAQTMDPDELRRLLSSGEARLESTGG